MTIHEPRTRQELERLLAPMRLTSARFERAVSVGAAERRSFSPGAPKSAGEMNRWFRTVEALHEELMLGRDGWRRSDPQNLPYFTNQEARVGLVVSSGDHATGVAFMNPTTRNPKGAAFVRRVEDNGMDALFEYGLTDDVEVDRVHLWVCLYDERDGFVHLELSRPVSVADSHVDEWSDRIIFPPLDLTRNDFAYEDDRDEDDFGFTIARR